MKKKLTDIVDYVIMGAMCGAILGPITASIVREHNKELLDDLRNKKATHVYVVPVDSDSRPDVVVEDVGGRKAIYLQMEDGKFLSYETIEKMNRDYLNKALNKALSGSEGK